MATVFISYSHDSNAHVEEVQQLARQLEQNGHQCILDQDQVPPEGGWIKWTMQGIEHADYVLLVCTETYKRRFEDPDSTRDGRGVALEARLIEGEIFTNKMKMQKYIPVVFEKEDEQFVPKIIQSLHCFHVGSPEGFIYLAQYLGRNLV